MRSFCEAFERTEDGAWRCIATAALQGPPGRIEVSPGTVFRHGTRVMGLDLAEFLDVENYVRVQSAASLAQLARRPRASTAAA